MRFSKIKTDLASEVGSAAIDFVAFGLVGSALVLFTGLQLGQAQHQQFIVQQLAKQTARALVLDADRANAVIAAMATQYGIAASDIALRVECQPACSDVSAIQPGSLIQVAVKVGQASTKVTMRSLR